MAEFHPLFPPDENDDDPEAEPPDIQFISVLRKENGKYITAPRTFMVGELQNETQLFAEFGGGDYQLVGKDGRHILRRKVLLTLPGPPKLMFDEAVIPKPAAAPLPPPPPMQNMGGSDGMMGLIMTMMQAMMAQQSQASQQSMQMMMAFIQSISQGSSTDKQAAQEAMNRQSERDAQAAERQMQMFVKLTEARQGGNSTGGEDSFFKGVEFMRHFSTQQFETLKAAAASGKSGGDFDLESLLESGMQALQAFTAFQSMKAGGLPEGVPTEAVT